MSKKNKEPKGDIITGPKDIVANIFGDVTKTLNALDPRASVMLVAVINPDNKGARMVFDCVGNVHLAGIALGEALALNEDATLEQLGNFAIKVLQGLSIRTRDCQMIAKAAKAKCNCERCDPPRKPSPQPPNPSQN